MQIDEYIMPEEEAAERLAMRLDNIDIVDSFKVSDRYSIIETKVPTKYIGMSLREADLTNKYKIIVLTTLKNSDDPQEREASGIAQSDTILHEKDLLVLFGELSDIKRLIEKGN
jgi:trk system potassium uptake protein TrkA